VCDTLRTRSAPPDAAPWTRWTGTPDPARPSTRLTVLVVGRNDPRFVPSANGLSRFTDRFAGEIVRRGDAHYDAARAVWNSAIDRRPELIVRPTDADDVVTALRFAVEQDLVIAVRCGGHSIPGLSTCDDGIVIDLSRMSGAEVDPEARTARVAGGSLLAVLDEAAQVHELVCPVGVVSHTGVAGLTLGGGMGRLQRKLGLTIDSLLAVDVVTADGRVVHASEEENPELFWGMRGAGPNFGIVTSFEFRLTHSTGRSPTASSSMGFSGPPSSQLSTASSSRMGPTTCGRPSGSSSRPTHPEARACSSPCCTSARRRRPSATSHRCACSARRSKTRSSARNTS
jgi:hypothetical protein